MDVKILILNFLIAIQGVESNHGKNINHPTIVNEKSMHYGDTAIGLFGLMPNTVKLLDRNPSALSKFKNDKLYERKLAKKYALKVLQSARGCPLKASILWEKGPAAKILPSDYKTPRYKKFVSEWETLFGPIDKDVLILRYCNE